MPSPRNVPEGLGLGLTGGPGTRWDTHTYPTDSARALVDSSDTKTWQANRWSAGCLVMNPKYLWEDSSLPVGGLGAWTPLGTFVAPHPATVAPDSQPHLSLFHPTYLLFFGWYPQKEMFFNWKKWLHLFPYRRKRRRGWSAACRGRGGRSGGRARGRGQGGHLDLLGVISLDAYLHAPHADLEDAAGGRVKVHGEPAGGGNLWVRDRNIRCGVPVSQDRDWAGGGHPLQGAGSRYLLHSGTEDVIAFVVGDLD